MVRVEVVFSAAPRQADVVNVELPQGSTAGDALRASGLPARHGVGPDTLQCGIWGRRCPPTRLLCDGDRVEWYRPLTVDPKQARRLRYKGQRKAKRPAGPGA